MLLPVLVPLVFSCMNAEPVTQSPSLLYKDLEFKMPVVSEPVFTEYTVSITDFGAVNDGQTLNTKAITDAINEVNKKGGGKIIIPRGLWLTGPIILKSNINLHT